MTKPKPQAKRVPPKLKSQILAEILLPNSSIYKIAKKYDLSSTTLYCWRMDYFKEMNQNLNNNEALLNNPEDNFIELVSEEVVSQKEDILSNKTLPSISTSKNTKPKLSEISLIFNNDVSLSLKGNIKTSSLMRIINCLEEESCSI